MIPHRLNVELLTNWEVSLWTREGWHTSDIVELVPHCYCRSSRAVLPLQLQISMLFAQELSVKQHQCLGFRPHRIFFIPLNPKLLL